MNDKYIYLLIGIILSINAICNESTKQYNVLMIIADDMNGFGINKQYPIVQTPYLDQLSEESINFVNATCNVPVCTPSRTSFFSGLHAHNTGAYLNGSDGWNRSQILKDIKNLPEWLKLNGYITWGRGKLTHAPVSKEREKAMWDNPQNRNGGFGPFPEDKKHWIGGSKFRSIKGYDDDNIFPDVWNADSAIQFIEQKHEKPFFMCYGLWRPHNPYTAPQRFFDLYDENEFDLPPTYKKDDLDDTPTLGQMLVDSLKHYKKKGEEENATLKKFLHAYAANTSFTDWNIGRVIEALDQSAYAKNTLVIIFSDNGFHCGSKMRWGKATLWDQADLVPMLVRTPKKQKASSTATVSLVDLFPTIIDYCSIATPNQTIDGQSFAYLLDDPKARWDIPSITTFGEGYTSIRNERYRYCSYPDGSEELYDHNTDPYEFNNISSDPKFKLIIEHLQQHIPQNWAETTGGRLEVQRDFDDVLRKLTQLHSNYEKLYKETNPKIQQ